MPSDDSAARVPPSLEADLGKVEENTLGSKDRIAEGTSQLSTVRKTVLLIVFCLAMFLDIFNVASLMSAIPAVAYSLNMNTSESTWIVSAFQLTFSAFLLASGKLSDVFSAKYAFVTGISVLPILSLITGFMHNKIALFVLRALGGIAGSLTIPAALTLIVRIFPQPEEQARAMGIFGATGALGNILGLVIGALLTQYTSWRWVFWFATILAVPAAVIGAIMIPKQDVPNSNLSFGARIKHMDIPGCTVLTVAIVLFILALTEASTSGWKSAIVIAPLVISVLLVVAFFIYEKWLPQEHAAIPSRTWFYKNFSILFGCALVPFFWFTTVFVFCTEHWQTVYHYSVVMATVRMLPVGVAAAIVSFSSPLLHNISVKYILLTGYAGMITGTVLLSQANTSDRYWAFVFPAFIIGGAGTMTIFIFANIGMFRSTPPTMAGTVGALFSSALQLGSAVGLAIVTSIYTSVSEKKGAESYAGRSAGWWFAFGIIIIAALSVAVFYDDKVVPDADTTASASPAEKMHEEKVSDQGSQT